MKSNPARLFTTLATCATLACTMLLSSTASAQNPPDEAKHYLAVGIAVGYAFGEKGGATVGPMINYEVIPPDWHDVGMGVTFQAMYRNAEAWTFSFAGRGGLLNVLSAQAELGFAYHTGYDKKPGGWGIHLGASLPLTLLLIDASPTIKGFISMSDTVGSELMLGGEALFPSAILTLCGQGCDFN